MKCENCGEVIQDGLNYCGVCGAKVEEKEEDLKIEEKVFEFVGLKTKIHFQYQKIISQITKRGNQFELETQFSLFKKKEAKFLVNDIINLSMKKVPLIGIVDIIRISIMLILAISGFTILNSIMFGIGCLSATGLFIWMTFVKSLIIQCKEKRLVVPVANEVEAVSFYRALGYDASHLQNKPFRANIILFIWFLVSAALITVGKPDLESAKIQTVQEETETVDTEKETEKKEQQKEFNSTEEETESIEETETTVEKTTEDIPETEESESTKQVGTYILPDSSTRVYEYNELTTLTAENVRIAINEIYAKHGRRFASEDLQTYFDSQSWYSGTIEPDAFSEDLLSQVEKDNLARLANVQNGAVPVNNSDICGTYRYEDEFQICELFIGYYSDTDGLYVKGEGNTTEGYGGSINGALTYISENTYLYQSEQGSLVIRFSNGQAVISDSNSNFGGVRFPGFDGTYTKIADMPDNVS